jgi:bifunctional oligoribonuclease and PAP phosphatase NrnA
MNLERKNIPELKAFLSETRKITITCHVKPDGDAMGSTLGLYHYLKTNHEVSLIVPSEAPEFLSWMPGNEDVITFSEETSDICNDIIEDSEILFCLDFGGLNRVGPMQELITGRDLKYVMVDHHLFPQDFDDYRYWSSEAAAAAELIFLLIEEFGDKEKITPVIATCLYTGIMTDTGSFRHSNTTSQVHDIVGQLIGLGADNTNIHRRIYDNNTQSRLRLLGHMLLNRLVVLQDSHTAYVVITEQDFIDFDIQSGDTEGLVNYCLSLNGIIFASMIKWSEEYTKLSLRSKGEFPANEIAGKFFNGGGHRNASGGRFDGSVTATEQELLKALKEFGVQLEDEFQKINNI